MLWPAGKLMGIGVCRVVFKRKSAVANRRLVKASPAALAGSLLLTVVSLV